MQRYKKICILTKNFSSSSPTPPNDRAQTDWYSAHKRHRSIQRLPIADFGVDVADIVCVCAIGAGDTVVCTVPILSKPIEMCHLHSETIEYGDLHLSNKLVAYNPEAVVGGAVGREDVGSENEDAVQWLFAPVRNDNEVVVDNAIADVVNIQMDRIMQRLRIKCVAIVAPRQLVWRNGIAIPRAVRTGNEVNLPQCIAARGSPIGSDIECVCVIQLIAAEGVTALAQSHSEGRVVVIMDADVGVECVGGTVEGTVAESAAFMVLVAEGDDAAHGELAGVVIAIRHILPVVVGKGQGVSVAKVPKDAIGRAFAPAVKMNGVVHTPNAVRRK